MVDVWVAAVRPIVLSRIRILILFFKLISLVVSCLPDFTVFSTTDVKLSL